MSERSLRYPLIWVVFIIILVTGAALLTQSETWMQIVGALLLASPIIVFGGLGLVYYVLERTRGKRPPAGR